MEEQASVGDRMKHALAAALNIAMTLNALVLGIIAIVDGLILNNPSMVIRTGIPALISMGWLVLGELDKDEK